MKGKRGFQKGNKEAKKKGKHKKTIEQEKALEFLRGEIRKNWGDLIDTKIQLAKGIWVERVIRDGTVKVYQEKPDSSSLEYVFSMVVGKPKESLELSGKIESILSKEQVDELILRRTKKDSTGGQV